MAAPRTELEGGGGGGEREREGGGANVTQQPAE